MQFNTKHISQFFQRVKTFEATHWNQKIEQEQHDFLDFKTQFFQRKSEFEALRKSEAPFFNLFEILNIRHLEETLHTPMLCHILHPNGSHEQGAMFLNAFFKQVLGVTFTFETVRNFSIYQELSTNYGRIDLLLKFNFKGVNKLIIIENKIYAGDQEKQLQRYYDYALSKLNSDNNLFLLYLTPTGKTASDYSMKLEKQDELRSKGILKEISYKNDIIPWLETTIKNTTSEKVKQSIIQYLATTYRL